MSEENEVAERPDLGQLTSIYLKIRDKRAENKREFENVDKDLEEQQKMLAEQMLDMAAMKELLSRKW